MNGAVRVPIHQKERNENSLFLRACCLGQINEIGMFGNSSIP